MILDLTFQQKIDKYTITLLLPYFGSIPARVFCFAIAITRADRAY